MRKGSAFLQPGRLSLSFISAKGEEHLKIRGDYPDTALSRFLFSQAGLMYLAASTLHKTISANFAIAPQFRFLMQAMYQWSKIPSPKIKAPNASPVFSLPPTSKQKVIIAYSGGKDSIGSLHWAWKKYGRRNVSVAHIDGLNKAVASKEWEYAKKQQKAFGLSNFRVIHLENGAKGNGYELLSAREIFLSALIIPYAIEFGASKVIIEGYDDAHPALPFSLQKKNICLFNHALASLGIPVRTSWRYQRSNTSETDVMKELLEVRPEWVPFLNNCFIKAGLRKKLRKNWKRFAPTFPLLPSQCGSCMKCRLTNIARLIHDPAIKNGTFKKKIRIKDVQKVISSTADWIEVHANPDEWATDLDWGCFEKAVNRAARMYASEDFQLRIGVYAQ